MLSKGMLFSAPSVLEMNEDATLIITTVHTKSYPIGCIIAKIHVKGDDFSNKYRIKCSGEKDGKRNVKIDTSHSGVTVFEIKRFWTVSLIGLFSLPVSINKRASVLVMPQAIKPANTIALQHGILLRPKPGGGYSEEHDMRTYRPGDPVRSIHWKVSAKFNSIIIREPLVPPPHSRLIHITKWENASQRDLILGRLRWVCDYMLKWQMPFYIKFDTEAEIAEVKEETDMFDYLLNVLDKNKIKMPKYEAVPSRFSWVFRVDAGVDRRNDAEKQEVEE